jgi:hypothetical protein
MKGVSFKEEHNALIVILSEAEELPSILILSYAQSLTLILSEAQRPSCHPERSVAKSKDLPPQLQF